MEATKKRTESEIFSELSQLCVSPGFIHVITVLCFRDNVFGYKEDALKPEDMASLYSFDRLIRTEISTLIGLMIKSDIDFTLPKADEISNMANRACNLLNEIHFSMGMSQAISFSEDGEFEGMGSLGSARMMREPIFYGGESAYIFQYRDLAVERYSKDNDWFIENKGYEVSDVKSVILCIEDIQNDKLTSTIQDMKELPSEKWTMLPAFVFSTDDICDRITIQRDKVEKILQSFSLPESNRNEEFNSISDFNAANAFPLIKTEEGEYLLPQSYTFSETFYDAPFYWFNEDKEYKNTAMEHRGEFTEVFSERRLKLVFGDDKVFSNVNIIGKDGKIAGEIDVLVVFSDRAIVVQAKSKKLTIESRKGDVLKDDFKKAIQNAYDQALSCAQLLGDEDCKLLFDDGEELSIPRKYKEIFPVCLISEHYPALSFQARQFLKYEVNEIVAAPFVMDIFLLDAMTEMLDTPLHFLSYLYRRALYIERLNISHELTALSYHLKLNLWLENDYDFVHLGDDISSDLDAAMMVRRLEIEGDRTPDGILTRFVGTKIGNLIEEIESQENASTLDLGFMLLTLSEDSLRSLSQGMETILNQAKADRKHHDGTVGISSGNTGLTIHSSYDSNRESAKRLRGHCIRRKYIQRAETWFGICVDPASEKLRFGLKLNFPWEKVDEMEKNVEGLKRKSVGAALATSRKIGRNEQCPCGSGLKYKKCCLA